MKYLGAQLASDGRVESEVAQKLGIASKDFKVLKRLWNHCHVSPKFKFVVFTACIVQKLLYSLESAWLNKALLAKIDGFYCRCLRQILKISPSFISRVSNRYVLSQLDAIPLSQVLLQRQLIAFGQIARSSTSVVRRSVFQDGTLDLADDFTKRRGRPRNTWAVEVRKKAREVAGERNLTDLVANEVSWKSAVETFIKSHAHPHDD